MAGRLSWFQTLRKSMGHLVKKPYDQDFEKQMEERQRVIDLENLGVPVEKQDRAQHEKAAAKQHQRESAPRVRFRRWALQKMVEKPAEFAAYRYQDQKDDERRKHVETVGIPYHGQFALPERNREKRGHAVSNFRNFPHEDFKSQILGLAGRPFEQLFFPAVGDLVFEPGSKRAYGVPDRRQFLEPFLEDGVDFFPRSPLFSRAGR